MKAQKLATLSTLFILVLGCGQSPDYHESYTATNEMLYEEAPASAEGTASGNSQNNTFISSSAAVELNNDSTRKFIRTANLRFKVKDVIRSTYDIEGITKNHKGFVIYTNLGSSINHVSSTAVSADSTLETTHYTVSNSIVLRVPNHKLDTVLKDISRNIDFLNYRIIKADDVALKILSNRLAQKRSEKAEQRIATAIDNQGRKLKETVSAEELLQRKQEQADNALISNLSLADQIDYSTINLEIYQRQSIKREIISNNKNIDEYKPGFGKKLIGALKTGWDILESLTLLLIQIWPLFLLGFIVYFIFKKYIIRKEK